MFAEQVGCGTMIGGRRVAARSVGLKGGRAVITIRFATTVGRKRRPALSEPVTYYVGTRVPGTRKHTTWAMPAGPVERKPGGELSGGWYGDGDDSGQGRADRHSRMIASLTYA